MESGKDIAFFCIYELKFFSKIGIIQEQYYNAIAQCHVDGASTIFIEFMLAQIDKILDDISVKMSEENEYLSDSDDDT